MSPKHVFLLSLNVVDFFTLDLLVSYWIVPHSVYHLTGRLIGEGTSISMFFCQVIHRCNKESFWEYSTCLGGLLPAAFALPGIKECGRLYEQQSPIRHLLSGNITSGKGRAGDARPPQGSGQVNLPYHPLRSPSVVEMQPVSQGGPSLLQHCVSFLLLSSAFMFITLAAWSSMLAATVHSWNP